MKSRTAHSGISSFWFWSQIPSEIFGSTKTAVAQ